MIQRSLRGLVAATVLVAAVSSAAEAQASSAQRFGINAGVALPMGDFGDGAGLGIHAGAHLEMPLGTTLKLRFNLDYGRYGGEDGTIVDNVTLLGGVANIIVPITTSSALKPYILGGIGYYNGKVEFNDGTPSGDSSELAFNFGAGYDFKMGNSNLFTEIRFLSIQTEGSATNTLPIVIGLRF